MADLGEEPGVRGNEKNAQKDLNQKRKLIASSNVNQDFILRKAFLKEFDQEEISKLENAHLKGMFGNHYRNMKQASSDDKKKLIALVDVQNRLTVQLIRILNHKEIPNPIFCKILHHIEQTITLKLLAGDNMGKFIFQTAGGKWFTFEFSDDSELTVTSIKAGPWHYVKDIYKEEGEVYCCKDVFDRANEKTKKESWMERFRKEFHDLWQCSNGVISEENLFDENTWDFYAIRFQNPVVAKTGGALIKDFLEKLKVKMPIVGSLSIEQLFFVVFLKDLEKSGSQKIGSQPETGSPLFTRKAEKRTSLGHKLGQPKKGASDRRASVGGPRLEDKRAAAALKMNLLNDFAEEGQNESKIIEDEKLVIPFKELMGIFQDLRFIIMPHKGNLFRKISYFVLGTKVDIEGANKDQVSQILDKQNEVDKKE